jgi:predicted ribosome quality control (RQC) complex YloA/Tae2 family protein
MPFDGILTKSIAKELNEVLFGGRIGKIHQISRDALLMQVRASKDNYRLLISCNASSARIQLTERQFENPKTPPVFCMLLRKHLAGGIIKGFVTNGYERIITIEAEVTDDLGDRSLKRLVVEIMGRHSNIILLNKDNKIIDAMKHVDSDVNRIRELLPARTYILPPSQDKLNPDSADTYEKLIDLASKSGRKIESFLLDKLQGFSPVLCREICFRAGIDDSVPASGLTFSQLTGLIEALKDFMSEVNSSRFTPVLVKDSNLGNIIDFHCIDLLQYPDKDTYNTISSAVDAFYIQKYNREFNAQRSLDLQKTVAKLLEKCEKRLAVNLMTYEENKEYDRFRLFGELITANIYAISKGMENAYVINYYSEAGDTVDIPLDKEKSPQQNAQQYFKKYNKARTAFLYAQKEIELLKEEISYLESILYAIENADGAEQLHEIRMELFEQGYIKSTGKKGKNIQPIKVIPQKIVSKDGFEISIGHNNKQNDRLTLKMSRNEDIWLHIKNFAGSHVVIKTEGKDVPDSTIVEAAEYAAWFSKARSSPKAEVDYTRIRNVKKPSGGKPGMVVYTNYHTVIVTPRKPEGI